MSTFLKHAAGTVVVVFVALAIVNNVAALAPVKKIVMGA